MSPQRRKGRGGGSGKTMAVPPSSSSSVPADSPDLSKLSIKEPRIPVSSLAVGISKTKQQKTTENHSGKPSSLERARSSHDTMKISSSEASKPTESGRLSDVERPKARASSTSRSRFPSSDGNLRSSGSSSSSLARTSSDAATSSAGRRSSSVIPRAESRPRPARASPNLAMQRKDLPGRDEAVKSSSARSRTSLKEDGKSSSRFSEKDETKRASLGSTRTASSLKNSSSILKDQQPEQVRWSTTALQNSRRTSTLEATKPEVSRQRTSSLKQDAAHQGRYSTGSSAALMAKTSKFMSENGLQKSDQISQNPVTMKETKTALLSKAKLMPEDLSSLSESLHKRLSLLEGKVNRISAELKKTKQMLDSNDCVNSLILLTDIEDKISNFEKVMSFKESFKESFKVIEDDVASIVDVVMEDEFPAPMEPADSSSDDGRVSCESMTTEKDVSLPQVLDTSNDTGSLGKSFCQGHISAPARVSGLTSEPEELEDRLFPHRKLMMSRLSISGKDSEHCNFPTELQHCDAEVEIVGNHADGGKSNVPSSLEQLSFSNKHNHFLNIGVIDDGNLTEDLDYELPKNSQGKHEVAHYDSLALASQAVPIISEDTDIELGQSEEANAVDADILREGQVSFSHGPNVLESQENNVVNTLECDETPASDDFDENVEDGDLNENVENVIPDYALELEYEEPLTNYLQPIGNKIAMAGWYISEGEAILLAHDDGCCSYYDVANMEEKSVYESPETVATPIWNDCWLIRAAGADGRSSKYVVAATAGGALDCGFCCWDYYSKTVAAWHTESVNSPANVSYGKNPFCDSLRNPSSYQMESSETPLWWYRPSGPLMASAASFLRRASLYDIRDGDCVMTWDTSRCVASLDYSCPIQWRDKSRLVLAEDEGISLWDVSTMDVQCLHYTSLPGKEISSLYVYNSDAESSGGVRQRLSSSETEAFDAVCSTQNDVNILDFRVPSGVAMCFPVLGQSVQSVFARGDMILTAGLNKATNECSVQQWSFRKAMPVCTYAFPASSSHYSHLSVSQVWGNSSLVMAINGNGLHIFKAWKDSYSGMCDVEELKDMVGTQDLFNPSFDYANSRILLVSKDRPAAWSFWPQ